MLCYELLFFSPTLRCRHMCLHPNITRWKQHRHNTESQNGLPSPLCAIKLMYSEAHPSVIMSRFCFNIMSPQNAGNNVLNIVENTHFCAFGIHTRPQLNPLLLPSNDANINSYFLALFIPCVVSAWIIYGCIRKKSHFFFTWIHK